MGEWDGVCKAFSSAQLVVSLQCGLCLWPQLKQCKISLLWMGRRWKVSVY